MREEGQILCVCVVVVVVVVFIFSSSILVSIVTHLDRIWMMLSI